MKLLRNTNPDGMCKYSLIEHQKGDHIEHGLPSTENEFFVLKLKDKNSRAALLAYANSAEVTDKELAAEVRELANRAGVKSQWCKEPD